MTIEELKRARKIARAMRDGNSTIGEAGNAGRWGEMPFHRPGSPYGTLSFDREDCSEAGKLFLRLLSGVKADE